MNKNHKTRLLTGFISLPIIIVIVVALVGVGVGGYLYFADKGGVSKANLTDTEIENAMLAHYKEQGTNLIKGKDPNHPDIYGFSDMPGGVTFNQIAKGDLDGDGNEDIIVVQSWCSASCGTKFTIILNQEDSLKTFDTEPEGIVTVGANKVAIDSISISEGIIAINSMRYKLAMSSDSQSGYILELQTNAGWEIYKNGKYGYQVKYPRGWSLDGGSDYNKVRIDIPKEGLENLVDAAYIEITVDYGKSLENCDVIELEGGPVRAMEIANINGLEFKYGWGGSLNRNYKSYSMVRNGFCYKLTLNVDIQDGGRMGTGFLTDKVSFEKQVLALQKVLNTFKLVNLDSLNQSNRRDKTDNIDSSFTKVNVVGQCQVTKFLELDIQDESQNASVSTVEQKYSSIKLSNGFWGRISPENPPFTNAIPGDEINFCLEYVDPACPSGDLRPPTKFKLTNVRTGEVWIGTRTSQHICGGA